VVLLSLCSHQRQTAALHDMYNPVIIRERELKSELIDMRKEAIKAEVPCRIFGRLNAHLLKSLGLSDDDLFDLAENYVQSSSFHPMRVDATDPQNPKSVCTPNPTHIDTYTTF